MAQICCFQEAELTGLGLAEWMREREESRRTGRDLT